MKDAPARRALTDEEKTTTVERSLLIAAELADLEQRKADLETELARLQNHLWFGVPDKETISWRHLYARLQHNGGTARVLFRPVLPGEDLPEMEWVASTMGLNRYNAAGDNTATWHPDPGDLVELIPLEE